MFWIWIVVGLVVLGLAAHLYDRTHRRQVQARGLERPVNGTVLPNTMVILDTQQAQHDQAQFTRPADEPASDD